MTLVRYTSSPANSSSVDRLASEIFGQSIGRFLGSDGFLEHAPRVNIVEGKDAYRVDVQVPGFDKKDLKIEMVNDTLTIRGEHTEESRSQENEGRFMRREFGRRAFERSFVLPERVQQDGIRAESTNGVLRITIPKSEDTKPRTRTISIQ
jgi:HSP20 family protein